MDGEYPSSDPYVRLIINNVPGFSGFSSDRNNVPVRMEGGGGETCMLA